MDKEDFGGFNMHYVKFVPKPGAYNKLKRWLGYRIRTIAIEVSFIGDRLQISGKEEITVRGEMDYTDGTINIKEYYEKPIVRLNIE